MEATKRLQQQDLCGLVLTYRVNDTLLCIPVEDVESVIEPPRMTEVPNAPDYVMGAFMHRGKTALALSLKKLLRLPASELHAKKESLLVVWLGDHPVGYWVDEIKGMTDSGRGHWSAVPALIRDQGITRALVCDGNVYFPLDLTQSRQFVEIHQTLEAFDKNRVHEVTEEDVQRALTRQAQQPVEEELPEEALAPEDNYQVPDYPSATVLEEDYEEQILLSAFAEHEPESDLAGLDYADSPAVQDETSQPELSFDEQGQADAFLAELEGMRLPSLANIAVAFEEASNEAYIDEAQLDAFDPNYLESLPPTQPELLFNEQGQADAFLALFEDFESSSLAIIEIEPEAAIEPVIDEAQWDAFDPAYLESLPPPQAELLFNEQGQADAFLALLADFDPAPPTVEAESKTVFELPVDEAQWDAFEADYLAMLVQEAEATVAVPEVESAEEPLAESTESLTDFEDRLFELDKALQQPAETLGEHEIETELDDLSEEFTLTDEPYSLLPSHLPEESEIVNREVVFEDRMHELDRVLEPSEGLLEDTGHEPDTTVEADELLITEEPYSLLPNSLPEETEIVEHELDIDSRSFAEEGELTFPEETLESVEAEFSIADEIDGLEITEEPYSLLPTSLPEEAEIVERALDIDSRSFAEEGELTFPEETLESVEAEFSIADEIDGLEITEEPYSLLPTSLPEETEIVERELDFDSAVPVDESEQGLSEDSSTLLPQLPVGESADETGEREQPFVPLALLPSTTHELPAELGEETVDKTTLPDMHATMAKAAFIADKIAETLPAEQRKQLVPETQLLLGVDEKPAVAEIPFELDLDAETEAETVKEKGRWLPKLPGGVVIQPDGSISRNYGLIKVFTIVLATSAAGAWWFRDELFHREQIRKEIPSILQNEIAYLYAERVRITNPPKGKTRMLVETPDAELHVIKRKYVTSKQFRAWRRQGFKLHRVRRGETLWSIAEKHLTDPNRYQELVENNRLHNPRLIRPGDVVKISFKVIDKK